ncbi:pseudouridine synthase, partial [Tribonema minus]
RINKCFKNVASRREADKFLEEGRVRVNKRTATTGARVLPGDRVTLDGKLFVYIKYWKPVGVTSTTDRGDATNVLNASGAERAYRGQRLFNVGRLDKDSSGALLLTSDGRLPGAALSAEAHQEKVYTVTVERRISDAALERMRSGVTITAPVQHSGKAVTAKTLPCQAGPCDWYSVKITLKEGRNRQIRRMCEEVGHKVKFLHRASFMGITLNGMREGEWKPLNVKEVKLINRALREAAQRDAPPAASAAGAPALLPEQNVDVTAAPSVEQRG